MNQALMNSFHIAKETDLHVIDAKPLERISHIKKPASVKSVVKNIANHHLAVSTSIARVTDILWRSGP